MKTLYVSSTERDMAGERELLHRQVIPAIEQLALDYGETVDLCDLRYNQTGAQEQSQAHLLSVCLDEIDRCGSNMIVLVGEHYGAFLGESLLRNLETQKAGLKPESPDLSLTALEIQYGALDKKDRQDKVLFYFRQIEGEIPAFCQPESPSHRQALDALKERILAWAGDRVRTYTVRWDEESGGFSGLDTFAAMVEEDLKALLQPQWVAAAKRDNRAKDLQSHWEMVHRQTREFSCRSALVSQCIRLMDEHRKPLSLLGVAGSGKSTLLSKLAQEFERRGHQVLPIFCGLSPLCRRAEDIMHHIIRFAEDLLGLPAEERIEARLPRNLSQWQSRLTETLSRYSREQEEELVILLSDLDRLTVGADGAFLPETLPERVKLAFSCTNLPGETGRTERVSLDPLTEDQILEMAQGILRATKQELERPVLTGLCKRKECGNPLYLRLALYRLTMTDPLTGKIARTTAAQLRLLDRSPADSAGLYLELLKDATHILGDGTAVQAGALLGLSRCGLRERDLAAIFRRLGQSWDVVSYARFRKLMGGLLLNRNDGRTDHRYPNLCRVLLEHLSDLPALHREMAAHLLTLPATDTMQIEEAPWHLLNGHDYKRYVNYIQSLDAQSTPWEEAAGSTAAMLLTCGKNWLTDLLRQEDVYGCATEFYAFLDEPLAAALGEDRKAMALHRDILLAAVRSAEHRAERLGSEDAWRDVTLCRNRAGQACYRLGDEESLALVAEMQERQLATAETILAKENTPAQRRKLMNAYRELAELYEKQGTAGKRKALIPEEKRLSQWQILVGQEESTEELSGLAQALEDFAQTCAALGNPGDLEKARDSRWRAAAVWQRLAQLTGDPAAYRKALHHLLPAAKVWGETPERREKALNLLLQTKDWYLALTDPTVEAREDLAKVWLCLGDLYGMSRHRESLLNALEMYQESFLLFKSLTKAIPTAEIRMNMARCYEQMGEIYGTLGGHENRRRAMALLNRSLDLRQKLHAKLDTAQTALDCALVLHRLGKLCVAAGGEGNLLQARKTLELALPLHQRVEQDNTAPETHKEMIDLRCAIAEIDAELAEYEAQRQKEEEERRRAQQRLEEEERAMEQGIKAESSDDE